MVKTEIDGREVEVERDRWAIDVAREMDIAIPSLCYHPALEPYGACRLCVVEVTRGKWTWLTTACDLPIREGLSIRTDTPAVVKARKMALELMMAQAPDAAELHDLARQMGVELENPRFAPRREHGKCILCGLCVRVCEQILGQSAICFSRRGVERDIGTAFDEATDVCIGCEACVAICPTGHIESVIKPGRPATRDMKTWQTELELTQCQECGRDYAPAKELEFIQSKLGRQVFAEVICPACRRSRTVEKLSLAKKEPARRGAK